MKIHARTEHVGIDDEDFFTTWTSNFNGLAHDLPLPILDFRFWILDYRISGTISSTALREGAGHQPRLCHLCTTVNNLCASRKFSAPLLPVAVRNEKYDPTAKARRTRRVRMIISPNFVSFVSFVVKVLFHSVAAFPP
jgi:hypothetical protein